jgi:hypothetical protein
MDIVTDETKIIQRKLGTLDPPRKKPKYVMMQEKLKLLYLEYINGKKELDIFLSAIANIIRLYTNIIYHLFLNKFFINIFCPI